MAMVIVPVGLSLGPLYPIVEKPDKSAPPEFCDVMFRQDMARLTPSEYVVWTSAFADAKRVQRLELGREALAAAVPRSTRKAADVDAIVDDLVKRELLLEYEVGDGLGEDVLRRLQLYPAAHGLGNEAGDPDWFHIGTRKEVLISVTALVYGLWASSRQEASIWDTCVKLCEDNAQAISEGEDLDEMSLTEPLEALSNNIPLLVTSGCAYVDWVS